MKNNKEKNKGLMKQILSNALNKRNTIKDDNDGEQIDVIKNQFETAQDILKEHSINIDLLSIINIDPSIINRISNIFTNLGIIKRRSILRCYFHKYKLVTLGYISIKEKMKIKFCNINTYLQKQLLSLKDGTILLKFNYNSRGSTEYFYKIILNEKEKKYYFNVHKSISEIQPYKIYNLEDLVDITIGFKSKNLINKYKPNLFKKYRPWFFLSLWFPDRTIDLYFDNDEEMNKWYDGIYFYNKFILKKAKYPNLSNFFITKLKLKLLYKLKSMKLDLQILQELKYSEAKNALEFQSFTLFKTLVLYAKACEKLNEHIFSK